MRRRGVGRGPAVWLALALAFAPALALHGCGSGKLPLEVVDPAAAPLNPTYEQVVPILDRSCVPCHRGGGGGAPASSARVASGLAARPAARDSGGEGEGSDYSTCAGIEAGLEGLRRSVLVTGSMPPGAWPRLDEREKLIVKRWIENGACSPCRPCR